MAPGRRTRFGDAVALMMRGFIRRHAELCRHAERLLDPIPRTREKVVYKVSLNGGTYWVAGREGSHPAEIQFAIELHEQKTFDQLRWNYLRPQDMEKVPAEKTMHLPIVRENGAVMMYDLIFTSKTNSVIHFSG